MTPFSTVYQPTVKHISEEKYELSSNHYIGDVKLILKSFSITGNNQDSINLNKKAKVSKTLLKQR